MREYLQHKNEQKLTYIITLQWNLTMSKRRLFISLIFVLKMTVTIFRGGGNTKNCL